MDADSVPQPGFFVHSGRLRVYLAGENRALSLSFLEPGDIYTTYTPTYVEAVAPSTLLLMETAAFARKLATDPSITPVMMRVLGRLLANAVNLVEDLAFREVPARLARFLLGLADRRGIACDEGWLIPLDLGMEDIASLRRHDAANRLAADQPMDARGCAATAGPPASSSVVDCLTSGDYRTISQQIFNRLTTPASELNGEMVDLMQSMQSILRRPVFMSWSGSTVFVVCQHRHQAIQDLQAIEVRLRRKGWLLEV